MPIRIDEQWQYVDGNNLSEKYVYVDAVLIGRVRRWRAGAPGDLTREWYTAECWKGGGFAPVEEPGAEYEEVLQLLVFNGVH
jgi:hypothetical protein